MKRSDIIECIRIGYNDQIHDSYPTDLPIDGTEAQYAYEFGVMMAREEFNLVENEMDEYIEQILYDSDSKLEVKELD